MMDTLEYIITYTQRGKEVTECLYGAEAAAKECRKRLVDAYPDVRVWRVLTQLEAIAE